VSTRPIFRESAIEAVRRGTEKDIVPRLVSRPITVCLWLFLGALLAGAVVAWSVKVPSYAAGSGAIVGAGDRVSSEGATAVLFLAPDQRAHLRVGRPVHVQVGSSGTYVRGAIAKVERGLIGPAAAARRYRLGSDLISQPSQAVIVRLGKTLPRAAYDGSRVTAKVEIGSQRLLALLPGLGHVGGGG
jgi:hypothetical protein